MGTTSQLMLHEHVTTIRVSFANIFMQDTRYIIYVCNTFVYNYSSTDKIYQAYSHQ